MIKERSPQYPSIGLKTAIEKTLLIWNIAGANGCSREAIFEFMGYSSVNGKALGAISALGKYGLLEGRGSQLRVSKLAIKILTHQIGSQERAHAILTASRKPIFFNKIYQEYGGKTVSNSELTEYLVMHRFTPSGMAKAMRSYRETEAFVYAESVLSRSEQGEKKTLILQEGKPTSVYMYKRSGGALDFDDRPPEQEETEVSSFNRKNLRSDTAPEVLSAKVIPTVTLTDDGFEISAGGISSFEQFDKLMRRLHAAKAVLEE